MPVASNRDAVNQSPPYANVDLFSSDIPLQEAVKANGLAAPEMLAAFGRHWGSAGMLADAKAANENTPRLTGDIVEFDPAYHRFMASSMKAGLHNMTWKADGSRAPAPAEVARAALYYMVAQVENGHMCPITMTRAAVGALAIEPPLAAMLMPKIASHDYDPRFIPWWDKSAITIGMGMTERQGGTDVRSNLTRAVAAGDYYRISGAKWFMSAPMCDAFLVLAQAEGGLTCFFMPRFRPDGTANGLHFERLKPKLGNASNASSEVAFNDAYALRVGAEGTGIRTILEMVQLTRIDCAIASAGIVRAALTQAVHHARHRSVFQKRLVDQPLMQTVLADLALTSEGMVAAVMRLARATDLAASDAREAARARLLTPAIKYWVCKSAPGFVYEAMECLGGNGYVDDSVMPRLFREAPVNAIWEGSGNVMCLDVLRAMGREPAAARDVIRDLARDAAMLPGATQAAQLVELILGGAYAESQARLAVECIARLAAAAALQTSAPSFVAEQFARAHLSGPRGTTYGAIVVEAPEKILSRALPA
ncbi:MAG: acyl-CoA dehydrogenase family protein [Pseudolabrys sp.]|nr:acyl-CoA dehydrogenase family protein [Pseudolabrys sp.]